MSTQPPKSKPSHRVSFARIVGQDDKGQDRLGAAREIGSVWPRQNGKGSIIRLDFIPIELTQRQGVLFLNPADAKAESGNDDADQEGGAA
jgi:sulfite reductase beta subunit-like hemoprotein